MFDLLYYVDGVSYKRKVDAFIAAKGNWDKVSGSIWDNKLIDCYDWKVEPKESYTALLKERALQIREKYSYITMLFSGGYDAYTMIKVFYDNNIHIDRVTLATTYNGHRSNSLWDEPSNQEWKNLTIPLMKHFEKLMPKTVFEYRSTNNVTFLDNFEKFFEVSGIHPYIKWPMFSDEEYSHDNLKNIYLYGDLDPDFSYRDGKFFFTIWDSSNIDLYSNSLTGVSFFTHPDFPKLHAKQCHMLKNYFVNHGLLHKADDLHLKNDIKRLIVRYSSPLHDQFALVKAQLAETALGIKHELMYKSLTPEYQKKYRDFLGFKIKGIPLLKLKRGIKVFDVEV